ncbi:MAG: 4Fe-4S binding protein [Candidatus Cloacimonetes bacterium]|jgi:ferredoxin|nr:4Fe-4S binding protein [Candidatus Cloacimonadota bacterium]MDY0299203.1 4Fe-4S binding protein [Candidatus Cloacimonadaceae bacterium]MCB5278252.1 4Fe-4S binding protein [Candidatus Cloacimonadota bacterium]MCK9332498.1 4Fe-4S binding protein [Candidatus Cloacimonadota bacterium]MDD2210997.1 4Fe-4S binding protein [Candidatus Cloacimonadota bacterium]
MKRQIIKIDEDKCNGCGLCIPGCPEGALQLIDGKARLISDLFCDGLGACIGDCPQGAILVEEREAEPYNEAYVMENIMKAGENTIKAHLHHLKSHGEMKYYGQALDILKENAYDVDALTREETMACGCSGTQAKQIEPQTTETDSTGQLQSELGQWPVQLTLINPAAQYFDDADLLISADCVPYAYRDFHQRFLKGKIVITFCPKLDQDLERYIDKLAQIFTLHRIKSISIVRMEVPCCGGTEVLLQKALERAGKMHFVKVNIISVDGKII